MFAQHLSVLILLAMVLSALGAPLNTTDHKNTIAHGYKLDHFDEVYDQRQNGSKNVQVDMDGVVLAWMPTKSLFSFVSLLDSDWFAIADPDEEENGTVVGNYPSTSKPTTGNTETASKPAFRDSNIVRINPEIPKRNKHHLPAMLKRLLARRGRNHHH